MIKELGSDLFLGVTVGHNFFAYDEKVKETFWAIKNYCWLTIEGLGNMTVVDYYVDAAYTQIN